MSERQRLYSEVVVGSSKSSGSEAELPQESREDGHNRLRVNWLDAYQLEEEDAALQKALSLSQVRNCLKTLAFFCLSIVRCGQIFTSLILYILNVPIGGKSGFSAQQFHRLNGERGKFLLWSVYLYYMYRNTFIHLILRSCICALISVYISIDLKHESSSLSQDSCCAEI